jgi:hypothetical protein
MGNQYSITVSDETDSILQSMKNNGYKMSQVIDAAVSTIGEHGRSKQAVFNDALHQRIICLRVSRNALSPG